MVGFDFPGCTSNPLYFCCFALSPSFIKVKTNNETALKCDFQSLNRFDRTNAPLRLPFSPDPLARCFVFGFPVILALSCMLGFEARFGPSRNQVDGFWSVPQAVTCWEVAQSERSDAQFHFGHVWTKNGNCCSAGSNMIEFRRNRRVCVWTCHITIQYIHFFFILS